MPQKSSQYPLTGTPDEEKSREQLILELGQLRRTIARMEMTETGRKQTKGKRGGSEELLLSLVENASDFIYVADFDGKFLFINSTFPGYTEEEVIGKSVFDFILPEYCEEARKRIECLFRDGYAENLETKMIHENGASMYLETRLVPIESDGKIISTGKIRPNSKGLLTVNNIEIGLSPIRLIVTLPGNTLP